LHKEEIRFSPAAAGNRGGFLIVGKPPTFNIEQPTSKDKGPGCRKSGWSLLDGGYFDHAAAK